MGIFCGLFSRLEIIIIIIIKHYLKIVYMPSSGFSVMCVL